MLPAFAAEAAAKAQRAHRVRLPRYKSHDTGCCSQSDRLLELRVLAAPHAQVRKEAAGFGGEWVPIGELGGAALAAVMRKAIAVGMEALAGAV